MDIRKIVEACQATSPDKELPRELRNSPPRRDVKESVLSTPATFALLSSIRRGGTFDDAA